MSNATQDWAGELTTLEAKAEIDSLEDLQQRRRQLMTEYATLRALHGPNGKWDARRKSMLEAMKIKARMTLKAAGEKITEAMVDAEAHADPQYIAFLDAGDAGAIRYVVVDNEITELQERIEGRRAALYAFAREASLQG